MNEKRPDPRLNAWRDDLADARLRGVVTAPRFVQGHERAVCVPVLDIQNAPAKEAGVDTQLLMGDRVRVFDATGEYSWVQAFGDGYVGYVKSSALSDDLSSPTHIVTAPRTFVYEPPELRTPAVDVLSMGSAVRVQAFVENRNNHYAQLEDGRHLMAQHVRPVEEADDDFVEVALKFLHTPYLWGGTSGFGLDCSGLIQLALRMCAKTVLRDTDMQSQSLGEDLGENFSPQNYQRGDVLFWPGHVGIMISASELLDANGVAMATTLGPLGQKAGGLEKYYGAPTRVRRLGRG